MTGSDVTIQRLTVMPEFGDFVLKRLNEIGLSQAEASRRGAFTRQSLGNWINGHVQTIQLRNILALSGVLGVSPYFLLQILCREMGTSIRSSAHVLHPGDHSRFVDDLGIPDNFPVYVGQVFVKRWAIQNTGTVAWRDRYLTCVDDPPVDSGPTDVRAGDERSASDWLPEGRTGYLIPTARSVRLPETAPGEIAETSVEFTAPDMPGTVRSTWRITDRDGEPCFPEHVGVWCQVRVTTF